MGKNRVLTTIGENVGHSRVVKLLSAAVVDPTEDRSQSLIDDDFRTPLRPDEVGKS